MNTPELPEELQASTSSTAGMSNKLFLGGLSWTTTEDTIREHFQTYGEIQEVIVMRDRITNKPRGFGFITFKDQEAADAACSDTHTVDGRTIDAKPSLPHGQHTSPKSKKIFVGGLPPETTEESFKQHFEKFGKVVEALIMVDHTSGRSRGFGFVTFEEEASVQAVFSAGSVQEINGKRVEVKTATPKGSGPIGRSPGLMLGQRLGLPGAALAGRYPEGVSPFGLGPAGYHPVPGYMPVPGYGGYLPYPYPGMMMPPGFGGYPYPGYPYPPGFAAGVPGHEAALQQQRAASLMQQGQRQQQWQASAGQQLAKAGSSSSSSMQAKRTMQPQRSSSQDIQQVQDTSSQPTRQEREAAAAAVAAAQQAPPFYTSRP